MIKATITCAACGKTKEIKLKKGKLPELPEGWEDLADIQTRVFPESWEFDPDLPKVAFDKAEEVHFCPECGKKREEEERATSKAIYNAVYETIRAKNPKLDTESLPALMLKVIRKRKSNGVLELLIKQAFHPLGRIDSFKCANIRELEYMYEQLEGILKKLRGTESSSKQ